MDIQELKAQWEDAKANLTAPAAAQRGIDLLVDYICERVAEPAPPVPVSSTLDQNTNPTDNSTPLVDSSAAGSAETGQKQEQPAATSDSPQNPPQ